MGGWGAAGSVAAALVFGALCSGPATAAEPKAHVLPPGRVVAASPASPLTAPETGEIRGVQFDARLTGVAWPSTCRTADGVVAAGAGHRLVVFSLRVSEDAGTTALFTRGTKASAALDAGGESLSLPMSGIDAALLEATTASSATASSTFCASVPAKTRHVELVMTQAGYSQRVDLWTLRRVKPAPGILYRPQTGAFALTASETGTATLPATAPTGTELPVHVSVTSAYLSAFPPSGTTATAPANPRVADLDVELLGTDRLDPTTGGAYTPDGTEYPTPLPASRLTFTPKGGKPIPATEMPGGVQGGYDTGLFDAWYVFVAPADTTAGTLRIAPGPVTGKTCALVGCGPTGTITLGASSVALDFPNPPTARPAQKTPPWVGKPAPPTGRQALAERTQGARGTVASTPASGGFPVWAALLIVAALAGALSLAERHRRARRHAVATVEAPLPASAPLAAGLASETLSTCTTAPPERSARDTPEAEPAPPASASIPPAGAERSTEPPPLGNDGEVTVRVMGTPVVSGWQAPRERTTVLLSCLCYLALHGDRPRSSEEMAAALGGDVSEKTARNNLSRLRRSVGDEHLPDAMLLGGYRMRGVVTDWGRFRELVAEAQGAEGERADELLAEALMHVRGRPLDGAHAGSFRWVDEENLDHRITAEIVRVAHELARRRLAAGDTAGATSAARLGQRASANDLSLYHDLFAAAHAAGDQDALSRLRGEAARIVGPEAARALAKGQTPFGT